MRVGCYAVGLVYLQKGDIWTQRQAQGEDDHERAEAGIGATRQGTLGLPEAERAKKGPVSEALGEHGPDNTLISDF